MPARPERLNRFKGLGEMNASQFTLLREAEPHERRKYHEGNR
jgi:hypothetical protein